jgi:hypothetical protein
MRFARVFIGGIFVGLALGMLLGASLAAGEQNVNSTKFAGVGIILAIIGVATARTASPKA